MCGGMTSEAKDAKSSEESGAETPRFRIMVLDDENSVLFALKLLIDALGYQAKDFATPDLAFDYLKSGTEADLFICDLRMPTMSGLEVLAEARKLRPDVPFVLMSAHATNQEAQEAKRLGAYTVLAKPFTPDQLHALVRDLGGAPVPRPRPVM